MVANGDPGPLAIEATRQLACFLWTAAIADDAAARTEQAIVEAGRSAKLFA